MIIWTWGLMMVVNEAKALMIYSRNCWRVLTKRDATLKSFTKTGERFLTKFHRLWLRLVRRLEKFWPITRKRIKIAKKIDPKPAYAAVSHAERGTLIGKILAITCWLKSGGVCQRGRFSEAWSKCLLSSRAFLHFRQVARCSSIFLFSLRGSSFSMKR